MNDAHLHLIFNHLPIVIPIVGLLVLIAGFLLKSDVVKRVALGIFVLGALAAFPASFTGDKAEHFVEDNLEVSHKVIHEHEEIAETFALLSYVLGAFALVGLWANWKQKAFAKYLAITVMVISIVVLYFAQLTGTTGGEIRHLEIRNDFEPATLVPTMTPKPSPEHH